MLGLVVCTRKPYRTVPGNAVQRNAQMLGSAVGDLNRLFVGMCPLSCCFYPVLRRLSLLLPPCWSPPQNGHLPVQEHLEGM